MPDTKKIDEPKAEAPKDDIRLTAMLNEIGRLKIESLAQSAGAVDPAKVYELVNKNVKASLTASGNVELVPIDENGERLRNADGTAMTVGQYVSVLKVSPDTGFYFHDGAASKAKDGAKTPGGFDVEDNPWLAATWNLTQQGAIMRRDKPYGERLKAAAEGSGVSSNPFIPGPGFNLTRQGQILRENPSLGEQLRQEARPPENPWLKSQFNLTKQVLIVRSDPTRAARLKAEALAINGPEKPKIYITTPSVTFGRRA